MNVDPSAPASTPSNHELTAINWLCEHGGTFGVCERTQALKITTKAGGLIYDGSFRPRPDDKNIFRDYVVPAILAFKKRYDEQNNQRTEGSGV